MKDLVVVIISKCFPLAEICVTFWKYYFPDIKINIYLTSPIEHFNKRNTFFKNNFKNIEVQQINHTTEHSVTLGILFDIESDDIIICDDDCFLLDESILYDLFNSDYGVVGRFVTACVYIGSTVGRLELAHRMDPAICYINMKKIREKKIIDKAIFKEKYFKELSFGFDTFSIFFLTCLFKDIPIKFIEFNNRVIHLIGMTREFFFFGNKNNKIDLWDSSFDMRFFDMNSYNEKERLLAFYAEKVYSLFQTGDIILKTKEFHNKKQFLKLSDFKDKEIKIIEKFNKL